jgi:hypothetical protein
VVDKGVGHHDLFTGQQRLNGPLEALVMGICQCRWIKSIGSIGLPKMVIGFEVTVTFQPARQGGFSGPGKAAHKSQVCAADGQ